MAFSFVGCGTNSTKEAAKDKIINLGKNEGNVYKNDFFKMSINIPDKWVVPTDEEFYKKMFLHIDVLPDTLIYTTIKLLVIA